MNYAVEHVPLAKIDIGTRRREDLGSIAKLKSSLERVGQIHPVTLRSVGGRYELVAGERRLESARGLGWPKLWARVGDFTDGELRAIELEENIGREDLTPVEASAARLRALEKEAESMTDIYVSHKKRGQKPGPAQALSGGNAKKQAALHQEISRNRRHVELAEAHPAFKGAQWKQSQALAARESLALIPKKDHDAAIALVTGPGVDPRSAVKMLETIATKPAAARKEILDLSRSDDPAKRSLAMTRAIQLPPVPPDVLSHLDEAIRRLTKAVACKTKHAVTCQSILDRVLKLRDAEVADYETLKEREATL